MLSALVLFENGLETSRTAVHPLHLLHLRKQEQSDGTIHLEHRGSDVAGVGMRHKNVLAGSQRQQQPFAALTRIRPDVAQERTGERERGSKRRTEVGRAAIACSTTLDAVFDEHQVSVHSGTQNKSMIVASEGRVHGRGETDRPRLRADGSSAIQPER